MRVPSLPLPGYPQVRVALPGRRLAAALTGHRAGLVHLAGPFVLGVRGMALAARLGLPAVAVYQTDLAGYARTYLGAGEATAWRRMRAVHSAADLTLAPSSAALRGLLEELRPDRLEVSDRTTLRWTGEWARRARVPAVMVSHETADEVLRTWGVPPAAAGRAADRLNTLSAHAYARIVCTTEWAEREFVRTGVRNVVRAPLGVDLERFRPGLRSTALRTRHLRGQDVLLLLGSRLPVEKRPGRALDAPAALRHTGVRAALVVAGDGPLRAELERRARAERLPAEFLGHVRDRDRLARLQASADLCLAPGPAETFGLPGPLRHPLARRQQAVNAVVHALSGRYDTVHLHASDRAWTEDRSLWSVDRLHPGERGHRRLAADFHRLLAERGPALGARPAHEPGQPPPTRVAGALWPATRGTGWLARRSTDLLPQLLGLAAAEAGHQVRGTSGQLDARAGRALAEALDGLPPAPCLRGFVPRARMEG